MSKSPPTAGTIKALRELALASLRARAYTKLDVHALRAKLDAGVPLTIVDCRAPRDFADGHLPGALNVSYRTFMDEWERVPRGRPVVTVCYVGMYSRAAAQRLARGGHEDVMNLNGGMKAWFKAFGGPDDDEDDDEDDERDG